MLLYNIRGPYKLSPAIGELRKDGLEQMFYLLEYGGILEQMFGRGRADKEIH